MSQDPTTERACRRAPDALRPPRYVNVPVALAYYENPDPAVV